MNRFTQVAVVVLALFSAACSDGPVTSDASVDRPQLTAQGGDLTKLAKYTDGRPKILLGMAWAQIGPAGGRVKLLDFELIIPKGAVSKTTKFTIRMPADPTGSEYVYAEFLPHGTRFAVPVTLLLPYKGTTSEGSEVHVMWNNAGTWVPFETSLTEDGRIAAKTNHFSEYGTEEGFSKGITLNGKPAVR